MLRRALAFGLVVDLHDLVAAGSVVELDPVNGEAVHVERALIGKRSADHENEGGWRHHWVLSRRGLREYGVASGPSPRAPAEMAFICW